MSVRAGCARPSSARPGLRVKKNHHKPMSPAARVTSPTYAIAGGGGWTATATSRRGRGRIDGRGELRLDEVLASGSLAGAGAIGGSLGSPWRSSRSRSTSSGRVLPGGRGGATTVSIAGRLVIDASCGRSSSALLSSSLVAAVAAGTAIRRTIFGIVNGRVEATGAGRSSCSPSASARPRLPRSSPRDAATRDGITAPESSGRRAAAIDGGTTIRPAAGGSGAATTGARSVGVAATTGSGLVAAAVVRARSGLVAAAVVGARSGLVVTVLAGSRSASRRDRCAPRPLRGHRLACPLRQPPPGAAARTRRASPARPGPPDRSPYRGGPPAARQAPRPAAAR
jgi:hypothetical protein